MSIHSTGESGSGSTVVSLTLGELADRLGAERENAPADVRVGGFSTMEAAGPTDVAFVAQAKYAERAAESKAAAFVVSRDFTVPDRANLRVEDVWAAVLDLMAIFYPPSTPREGIHPTAVVGDDVRLGRGVSIGAYCCVGSGVRVGEGTVVGSHGILGEGVEIGNHCKLHPRVSLLEGVRIGDRVIIHPGAVLGSDGFKYEKIKGRLTKIPQVGAVVVEDDVEIGVNTVIDRAFLVETHIGAGTKIDNLVQIAHNVRIGKGCILVAQVGVAGSSTLGDGCILAGQAGIRDNVSLGNGVVALAQAGVAGDIADGETVMGSPAMPMKRYSRCIAVFARLPELARAVRQLKKS